MFEGIWGEWGLNGADLEERSRQPLVVLSKN